MRCWAYNAALYCSFSVAPAQRFDRRAARKRIFPLATSRTDVPAARSCLRRRVQSEEAGRRPSRAWRPLPLATLPPEASYLTAPRGMTDGSPSARSKLLAYGVQFFDPKDAVVKHAVRIAALGKSVVKDSDVLRDHLAQPDLRSRLLQVHPRG